MPYEIDDLGIRIIGYNVPIEFYDPTRTLRCTIALQPDNTLALCGVSTGGYLTEGAANKIFVRLDGNNWALWQPSGGMQSIVGSFNLAGAAYTFKINGAHALSMPGTHNLLLGAGVAPLLEAGGTDHVIAGYGAGAALTTADDTVIIGSMAAAAAAVVDNAIVIGPNALRWMEGDITNSVILIPYTGAEIEDISSSVLIGYNILGSAAADTYVSGDIFIGAGVAGNTATYEGNDNIIIGSSGGYNLGQYTYYNVGIGSSVFYNLTTGEKNSALGASAGHAITTTNGGVFLGYQAGYYETAANKLFIDNDDRTDEADARLKALVYGIFAATTVDQEFTINAQTHIQQETASVNAVQNLLYLRHYSTAGGTAAGFGAGQVFELENDSNDIQTAGIIDVRWTDPDFTNETAKMVFSLMNDNAAAASRAELSGAGVFSASRLQSTIAIGTPPLIVTSTTLNTNLNADAWDSLHAPADAIGILTNDGGGGLSWGAAGAGDVTGPGASTDHAIARWDGVDGDALLDSGPTIADEGGLTLPDDAQEPPLNVTERGAAPGTPAADDMYVDDGSNTASGSPGWRRYTGAAWEDMGAAGGAVDANAIHDNVAGEIAAIDNKAVPVDTDMLIIEDYEDGNAKKMIFIGDLPGGGGAVDASDVTYTPSDDGDWDGDVDPGNADDAFDQLACRTHVLEQYEIRMLFSQVADVTVTNTTDETSILGSGRGSKTLPAHIWDVGTVIRLTLYGHMSDTGTPTLDEIVSLGGVEVCGTGVVTLLSGIDELGWSLNVDIVCRTTGETGTVVAAGIFEYNDGSGHRMTKTTTTTIDTTAPLLVDVTDTWGAAAAGNTKTTQMATIEILKADDLAPAGPMGLTAVEV